MINLYKVQAMTRKSRFEIDEGREALRLKKYSENSPLWKGMVRGAMAGFLLYLLILLLAVLAEYDWFADLVERIGVVWTTVIAAASMAVFVAGYTLISDVIFRNRYRKVRSMLCRYRTSVQRLDRIERDQLYYAEAEEIEP